MTADRKIASRAAWLVWCLCLFSLQPLAFDSARGVDVAVVVHPDTPVTNLTLAEARKVFLGNRQYWSTNITVVLLISALVARERNVVIKTIFQISKLPFK